MLRSTCRVQLLMFGTRVENMFVLLWNNNTDYTLHKNSDIVCMSLKWLLCFVVLSVWWFVAIGAPCRLQTCGPCGMRTPPSGSCLTWRRPGLGAVQSCSKTLHIIFDPNVLLYMNNNNQTNLMLSRKDHAGSGPSCSWSAGSAVLTEKTHLLRKRRKRQSYSLFLLHTLGRSFGPDFLCGTLCLLLHDAFMFAVPQVLRLVSERSKVRVLLTQMCLQMCHSALKLWCYTEWNILMLDGLCAVYSCLC